MASTGSKTISFPKHARSEVKGGHSSEEIELIHVGFPKLSEFMVYVVLGTTV
jgi:hypothetical protein